MYDITDTWKYNIIHGHSIPYRSCSTATSPCLFSSHHRRHSSRSRPYRPTRPQTVKRSFSFTVKVNHIPLSVKEHQLDSLFGEYGSCEAHLRHEYGQNERYAFVNYCSQEAARTAARELNGTMLNGGRLTVKLQGESSTRSSVGEYIVKVENLSKTTTEDTLEDFFGFFDNVEVASIKINRPPGSSFNYAYVNYYNAEDAQRAVDELNNTKIEGLIVKVKLHQSQGGVRSPLSASPMDHGWHPSLS